MPFLKKILLVLLVSVLWQCQNEETSTAKETIRTESAVQEYKIVWHWVDEFTDDQKDMLKKWLEEITLVTRKTIGVYQFDVHYYLYLSTGNEPVPYAHTSRKNKQESVHFYVNPSFSLEDFLSDWTAQHEISHLSIPFIGKQNMWFSEGYATYLSRKIMIEQGYYTNESFDSLYFHRIANDNHLFESPELTVVTLCDKLRSNHNYSSIYYAGSSYFYQIDKLLQNEYNTKLIDVIKEYQKEKRLVDKNLNTVIGSFDKIINGNAFSELFEDYNRRSSVEVLSYFNPNLIN